MPTHVALLRGINVGGGGKIVMADLRRVVNELGHRDVATYIQTGNIVFTTSRTDATALARELEAEITARFNVRTSVILLSRAELATVVDRNPYPAEPNPRFVHAVFLPGEPDEATSQAVRDAVAAAAGRSSPDKATLLGRTVYLHTPAGFGNSELARSLLVKRSNPVSAGTARNWATVTKMLSLCGAAPAS